MSITINGKRAGLSAAMILSVSGLALAQQSADMMEERIENKWSADPQFKACKTCDPVPPPPTRRAAA
jgi:hypothetical protein